MDDSESTKRFLHAKTLPAYSGCMAVYRGRPHGRAMKRPAASGRLSLLFRMKLMAKNARNRTVVWSKIALGIVVRTGSETGGQVNAAMLSLEFSPRTGHGRFGLSDCFEAAGFDFDNYVTVTASAPEERDSTENNEGVPFVAHALGYGEEVNRASLEEAWRCLENDGDVPDGVTLEAFLYADSCVVATEEVQDVLGNSQGNPGSYTDVEGETPCNIEVPATRDRLGPKMPRNSYGLMNAVRGHL